MYEIVAVLDLLRLGSAGGSTWRLGWPGTPLREVVGSIAECAVLKRDGEALNFNLHIGRLNDADSYIANMVSYSWRNLGNHTGWLSHAFGMSARRTRLHTS